MKKSHGSLVRHLHEQLVGDDPERPAELEEARFSAAIARQVHSLRKGAGLTQRQLAARVGTQHSVISRVLPVPPSPFHSQTLARASSSHHSVRAASSARRPSAWKGTTSWAAVRR